MQWQCLAELNCKSPHLALSLTSNCITRCLQSLVKVVLKQFSAPTIATQQAQMSSSYLGCCNEGQRQEIKLTQELAISYRGFFGGQQVVSWVVIKISEFSILPKIDNMSQNR